MALLAHVRADKQGSARVVEEGKGEGAVEGDLDRGLAVEQGCAREAAHDREGPSLSAIHIDLELGALLAGVDHYVGVGHVAEFGAGQEGPLDSDVAQELRELGAVSLEVELGNAQVDSARGVTGALIVLST